MSHDSAPLLLYVDFNESAGMVDDKEAYCINFGVANLPALETNVKVGSRAIFYSMDLRCEGVVQRGERAGEWIGVVTPGTFKDLEPGDFERLEAATKRAADEV